MSVQEGQPLEKLRWNMLVPLLAAVLAFQGTVPLARVGATYMALEAGVSVGMITIISAGYALLPVFFAVSIGKVNDRGSYGNMAVLGAAVLTAAVVGILCIPSNFHSLLVMSAALGMAQTMLLNSTQMFVSRYKTAQARDAVLGYYMVATSLGQILGPLGISLTIDRDIVHPGPQIMVLCIGGAAILFVAVLLLRRFATGGARNQEAEPVTIASVLKAADLRWVIIASSLCLTASDLLLVFLPVLAVELGVPAAALGTILAIRATVTLLARFVFVRLINLFGRTGLMVLAMLTSAAGFALLALPMNIWGLTLAVALCGLGLGLALPTALSLTFAIAPSHAVGTVTSVRMTASRLSQFLIPLPAGLVAAAAGTGLVFATLSLFISATAFMTWRRL